MPTLSAVTAFLPSPDVQVLDMPVDPNEPTYCLCHQVQQVSLISIPRVLTILQFIFG